MADQPDPPIEEVVTTEEGGLKLNLLGSVRERTAVAILFGGLANVAGSRPFYILLDSSREMCVNCFKVISNKRQEIRQKNGYKNLIAWEKSDQLACLIYEITAGFPRSELFGLTSQLRRAALSIPANIVEGYARASQNEFHRFLSISLGSLAEVGYFLDFSYRQKIISKEDFQKVSRLHEECGRIIWSLYKSKT